MANFDNQVVVITGASSGIGAALAQEFGRRGAKVVLTARRKDKLEEVARLCGPSAYVVPGDMTRREDVQAVFAAAKQKFGQLDIWVNNAGRGISKAFGELVDSDIDAMMRDNLKSALYGMQTVLPYFKEKERRAGVIVNVSSMLGRVPFAPARAAYSASKAALNSLTESLRFEIGREFPNIRAVIVLPGIVGTDFGNNSLHGGVDSRALPGAQDVHEVAKLIADGIRDGKMDIYTRQEQLDAVVLHIRRSGGANSH